MNFLSTGNSFTEIKLNRSQTTLLTAKNGGGKSTVIDAIVFALYGVPFRKINKPSLVNSINKRDLLVEIEFSIGNVEYKVRRGIKPNVFEVYKNGELINQAADAREYQTHLETNILKMNKSSFCQIVVLGSATYVPFMMLSPYQRREIIEDLLDIKVFSLMNTLLKQRVSTNKDAQGASKYKLDLIKERIQMHQDLMQRLSQDHDLQLARIVEKIENTRGSIETLKEEQSAILSEIDKAVESIKDQPKNARSIEQLNLVREKLNDKIVRIERELAFYHDNETCPSCKQGIEHEFRQGAIEERTADITEIKEAFPNIESSYAKLSERFEEIQKVNVELQQMYRDEAAIRARIATEEKVLIGFENELKRVKAEAIEAIDNSKLVELVAEQAEAEQAHNDLARHGIVLAAGSALLKDGGIKSKIIKQYIPIMNKLINKYLAQMDFFVQFELDENFDETIKSRFRDDFGYENFSEGEKLRIDLAILFAWRAIAKMRNSATTNLLIMDEVLDGSLDSTGMDEFLNIIKEVYHDSNVFIISHRGDQLFDKFHSVIKFEKQGNFSRVV